MWYRVLLGAAVSGGIHFFVWWTLVKPAELREIEAAILAVTRGERG